MAELTPATTLPVVTVYVFKPWLGLRGPQGLPSRLPLRPCAVHASWHRYRVH